MLTKAKLSGILFGLMIFFVILHNMFYAILGVEEPIFLILSLLFAFVFVIYLGVSIFIIVYNAIRHKIIRKRRVH